MRLEIESAANFLSDLLRLHSSCVTSQQLEQFRLTIIDHLVVNYQKHWFPDQPFKGSGYRCLRINHKMDPMLTRAGQLCGLDDSALRTLLPNELTLWIDPQEVSYRIGENGSICVIYDINSDPNTPQFLTKSHNYSRLSPSPPNSMSSSASSSPSSSPNWYNNYSQHRYVDRHSPTNYSPSHHLVSSAKKSSFYINSMLS